MVYVVKSKGHTVDMVKRLKDAENSFKDVYSSAQLFAIAHDGSAKLLKQK